MTWQPMTPQRLTATADSNGHAEADFGSNVGLGTDVQVSQISVQTNGATGSCTVTLDDAFVCGSAQGWLDVADGDPPILVQRGARLKLVWDDAGAGTTCTALLLGEQLVTP